MFCVCTDVPLFIDYSLTNKTTREISVIFFLLVSFSEWRFLKFVSFFVRISFALFVLVVEDLPHVTVGFRLDALDLDGCSQHVL